jgi:glycosyltransferase involved in cell wall biosynthesis
MKFLVVIPSWSYRGGERIFLNLALGLQHEGHKVTVIAGRKDRNNVCFADPTLKIIYPPRLLNILIQNNLIYLIFIWFILYYLIRREKDQADWIISESHACLTSSVLAVKGTKTKVVWYVMHCESSKIHNLFTHYVWECTFGIVQKFTIKRVDLVFSLSERTKLALKNYFSLDSIVIPPIFYSRKTDNLSNVPMVIKEIYNKHLVLFLPGIIHWKKNHKLAIDTINALKNNHPDIRLVIAGRGEYELELRQYIEKHNLNDYIYFSGLIFGDTLQYCYEHAAMTLVCSHGENEGFSLTAFESLINSTPVLVSSQAGAAKIINKYDFGYVCAPHLNQFIKGADEILRSPEKFRSKAFRGKKFINNQYNEHKIALSVLQYFKRNEYIK